MENNYTAIIEQSGNFWIGWIKEISGVNCQELSRESLIETLRITLLEAIEFKFSQSIGIMLCNNKK